MSHIAHAGKLGAITLPLELFRDPRLNGSDIAFIVALLEYRDGKTGRIDVGGASIQAISGVNSGNLGRTIKRLVSFGWLNYTKGNHATTNDYTVVIPLETGFAYRKKATRYSAEAWGTEKKRREDSINGYKRKNTRGCDEWWALSADEIIAELVHEQNEDKNYIPDEILKNWEIVRGGDNSYDARVRRRDAAEGIVEMFEV
ncbi:MAG: hypothetical protein I8H90_10810 [Burkholderiales bacterium]|nr:hypothetical protein [Burkholderiales bacterium]MBH2069383.1 hypothetical protein [Burkholderiales bacterium]